MSKEAEHPNSAEDLVYSIDVFLERRNLEDGARLVALIALNFCDLLEGFLTDDQRKAANAARGYWEDGYLEDRLICISEFSQIIDSDRMIDVNAREASINRLVWCALNANTDFSGYAAEFLIDLGAKAGLDLQEMSDVFLARIPGFLLKEFG